MNFSFWVRPKTRTETSGPWIMGQATEEVSGDADKCLVRPWDESQLEWAPVRTELGGQ